MASTVAQADLRRDKIWLGIILVMFLIGFGIVFKPIRKIKEQPFTQVYFTYRYEKPFGPSQRAKDEVSTTLQGELTAWELPPDTTITFPAAADLKFRVPCQDQDEAAKFDKQLQKLLDEKLPKEYGKRLSARSDLSGFPDEPVAQVAGFGIYRPRVHMRLGLDLQGGVHLVLKARTQNVQFEYKLADKAPDLIAALDAADKTQPLDAGAATPASPDTAAAKDATKAPAEGTEDAKAPVEPAKDGAEAKDAKAPAAPAKDAAEAKDAKAPAGPAKDAAEAKDTKAPAEPAKDAKASGTQPANPTPDGGEPIRVAQAPAEETPASGEEEPVEELKVVEMTPEEASALADENLQSRVEERLQAIVSAMKAEFGARLGDVHAEIISSNIVVIRTHVNQKEATAQQQQKDHASLLLAGLKKVFPKVAQLGEPQVLKLDDRQAMKDVSRIIGERIDRLGVAEAQVREQGLDRVVVELPGVKDPEEAVQILGTTARMEFRKVPEQYVADTNQGPGGRPIITFKLKDTDKTVPHQLVYYEAPEFNGDKNVFVGSHLEPNAVQVTYDNEGKPAISMSLNREGSRRFDAFASENQEKFIAMFLDRRCIDVRQLRERHYGGQVLLTGGFTTTKDATNLKVLLESGALPVPVDVVEQRMVSATLGADSVRQSSHAALWGLFLILVTMVALYRVPGFLATLALIEYAILVMATLQAIDATLTLPGILGFILSVGMAVDGNVISFERLKEELRERSGRPIVQCIRNSYELSFAAIFDGNITTMISGVVLFLFGTGPIRGFAVTLTIGTMWSMFSALVVTRKWQNLFAATKLGADRRWYRG